MGFLHKYLLVLAVFLFNDVQSSKVCDFKNIKCLTKAAQNNFKMMVNGIPNLMEPLQTLHEDKIVGNMMNLEYVLTNTTLYGVKDCEVELLSDRLLLWGCSADLNTIFVLQKRAVRAIYNLGPRALLQEKFREINILTVVSQFIFENHILNTDHLEFEYIWHCPHLILDTDFAAKGNLANINIDHEGSLEITADDYRIKFKGTYGKVMDSNDQKLRVFIDTYDIDTEPKKKIAFSHKLRKGDETMADSFLTYFNDNWQTMEKLLRSPTLNKLLTHFVEPMKVFLKALPVDEILSEID